MSNFKVGDLVSIVDNIASYQHYGLTGVVTEVNGDGSVEVDYSPHEAGECREFESCLILAKQKENEPKSPIEEKMVLCRRVHYGEYGNLTLYESKGDLRIEFNKSKHTAEELEEAAHILVQVAEFLRSEEVK